MKTFGITIYIWLLVACGKSPENSVTMITIPTQQDSLFQSLIAVTQQNLPESLFNDSLSFLILPVQASCPSCRKKTIDSIMKYQHSLAADHYIIISANGGRKLIRSFFREQNYELPSNEKNIFLDSNNLAYKYKLYENKPTMYYTYEKKAYKKVSSVPATVKNDLHDFFSVHP